MATLTGGGSSSFGDLYFSSNSSIGFIAAQNLESSIGTLTVDFDTVQSGTSGTMTAVNQQLDIGDGINNPTGQTVANGLSTLTAANYTAIVDNSVSPLTMFYGSTVEGGSSVLIGSGGGEFFLDDNSNATVVAGDGNNVIGHRSADGSVKGTGSLDVTLGNGNNQINDLQGNATITTGTGSNIINLNTGNMVINFNGTGGIAGVNGDTVNAGVGAETVSVTAGVADGVIVTENGSALSFTNGAAISEIRGGGNTTGLSSTDGATTINAGGTAAVLYLAEAYDFFTGGQNGTANLSTLFDQVTDNSSTNDTLVAGAGTTSIDASGSTGSVLLEAGRGSSTLTGSTVTGAVDTFEINGLFTGTHSITIANWNSGDKLELQGVNIGASTPLTQFGTSVTATLTDGTLITFTNTTVADITHII